MYKNQEQNSIVQYLILTFIMAWGIEAAIIAGEQFGILAGTVGSALIFLLIGFGAGFAPAYTVCILLKKQGKIHGLKDILKLILQTPNIKQTLWITLIFFGSQLLVNVISEEYLGNPWYLFILLIPAMIIGGGVEELGWRGFLQPQMEKKYSFAISSLIVGVIWSCWHLPLWLVRTANQSSMNFLSFLCYCITFGFVLGLLYRLTKSTFACVLLHAWGNVLQGMFTRNALTEPISVKMAAIWGTEILIVIIVSFLINRLKKVENSSAHKTLVISTLPKSDEKASSFISNINTHFTDLQIVHTEHYEIGHCIGCTNCWLKTPGVCAVKDDYEKIFKSFLKADTVILLTEAKLGFISYKMKNIVDRLLPLAVPYTRFYNGEARHVGRYKKSWNMGLVYSGDGDKLYLNEWMGRFALNFHSKSLGTYHIEESEAILHEISHFQLFSTPGEKQQYVSNCSCI